METLHRYFPVSAHWTFLKSIPLFEEFGLLSRRSTRPTYFPEGFHNLGLSSFTYTQYRTGGGVVTIFSLWLSWHGIVTSWPRAVVSTGGWWTVTRERVPAKQPYKYNSDRMFGINFLSQQCSTSASVVLLTLCYEDCEYSYRQELTGYKKRPQCLNMQVFDWDISPANIQLNREDYFDYLWSPDSCSATNILHFRLLKNTFLSVKQQPCPKTSDCREISM